MYDKKFRQIISKTILNSCLKGTKAQKDIFTLYIINRCKQIFITAWTLSVLLIIRTGINEIT